MQEGDTLLQLRTSPEVHQIKVKSNKTLILQLPPS